MKSLKSIHFRGIIYSSAILFLISFSLGSCSRKIFFESSPVVPAASGLVKIKKDNNNNYTLNIKIRNLAEARRLDPPKETYVVWIATNANGTKNVGQMNSNSGLFSSKLKASLKAITPFKPTQVFITAEDNGAAQYPGLTMVLRTRYF